jgi:hypothetical protein
LIESVIDQRRSVDLNQVNTVKTRKQHRTKRRQTQRRTKRRLTQRRTKRRQNNKKTQKKKLDLCDNHLFILKEREKRCRGGDSRPKKTQNHPSMMDQEERKLGGKKFLGPAPSGQHFNTTEF